MSICSIQVRGNMCFLALLHFGSATEHLQQINFPWCVAAPFLHADCVLSICCLSSQVHGVLSASCHSTYHCRLSKSSTTVYKMDLQFQRWDRASMLNFIHCPDEKLNLALPTRKARYRTSKDPCPFKSHNFTSSKGDWMGKSLFGLLLFWTFILSPTIPNPRQHLNKFHCTTHFYCYRAEL